MERIGLAKLRPAARARRIALYATRYFDCNPLRYRADRCYNPLAVGLTYVRNRLRFHAVARPYGVIRVDPNTVCWNLGVPAKRWPIGLILDGDWDLLYRRPVDIAWKISAARQRFVSGFEWEDTDLFQRFVRPKFAKGERVRGTASLTELADVYRRVYDPLFEAIRKHGFLTPSIDNPGVSFVYVHVDRGGEFMFTRGGNHRLGMAVALGLRSMPVRVVTRHLAWQRVREEVKQGLRPATSFPDHPDLRDLRGEGS